MSRCIAFTRDGDQCERDNLNDKIPYCWQHARQRLEKTLWGSDQVEDSGDDLTPEEVYAIVMAAIRNSNPDYPSGSINIVNQNEINITNTSTDSTTVDIDFERLLELIATLEEQMSDLNYAIGISNGSVSDPDICEEAKDAIGFHFNEYNIEETMNNLAAKLEILNSILGGSGSTPAVVSDEETITAQPPESCNNPEHDDLRDRINELNYLYAQLHDEHARCQSDKSALQASIDSLSSSLQETTSALIECRADLADCQESEIVPDNGGTGTGELPGVVTEEEESPDDSGTFWSGVLDLPDVNPVLTVQQCPEKIAESDLSHLKPENSVGMFVCSDENIRHSGDYSQAFGKDIMYADLASVNSSNDLSTYFSTAPGMYNAWDKQMAIGSWVKPGDWFFFKGADGFWYGNVIESVDYRKHTSTGTQQLGYTHYPERTKLKFVKEYPFTNLGEGVPFAIIIFNPES